jgi:hypothetical protein
VVTAPRADHDILAQFLFVKDFTAGIALDPDVIRNDFFWLRLGTALLFSEPGQSATSVRIINKKGAGRMFICFCLPE